MKLSAFRVTKFRSVEDSEWIEVDDLAALIGTNEAGKTNLLLPLWKLNPVRDGEIDLLADMPRHAYHTMRERPGDHTFVSARFDVGEKLAGEIAEITSTAPERVRVAEVRRSYDGKYEVDFPDAEVLQEVSPEDVREILERGAADLENLDAHEKHEGLKVRMINALRSASESINGHLNRAALSSLIDQAGAVKTGNAPGTSNTKPRYEEIIHELRTRLDWLEQPHPRDRREAVDLVLEHMPHFVYYSNYGNLDSEIYLPHVVQNLERTDLGPKEAAKARTLRVLFDFVKLDPKEVLELGKEAPHSAVRGGIQPPAQEEIESRAKLKEEREVLLQSASVDLSEKFRAWWKQGHYKFRFQADGSHFRIWVSDDRRPEEVKLEGRSSGLQWFLSFYLVFLVESEQEHADTVLLLDEPGLSLHPIAQRDLSAFFDNLSKTNQLLYTTHSPFMVDPSHLDRVRAVYVDEHGKTAVAKDLRATQKEQQNAIYLVDAALGIGASEGLMYGAEVVIVEGTSDVFYFSAVKAYLVGSGLLHPGREYVFVSGGGARGLRSLANIFTARNGVPPVALLDGDQQGKQAAQVLRQSDHYQEYSERVVVLDDVVGFPGAEAEDLWPTDFIVRIASRFIRGEDVDLEDVVEKGKPIVDQIERFAADNGVELETGWKVEVARRAKKKLLDRPGRIEKGSETAEMWAKLFSSFPQEPDSA